MNIAISLNILLVIYLLGVYVSYIFVRFCKHNNIIDKEEANRWYKYTLLSWIYILVIIIIILAIVFQFIKDGKE